jgi:hypothetical protein
MTDRDDYVERGEWCYSPDGERYEDGFESREEALAEGAAVWDRERVIWTGRSADPLPRIVGSISVADLIADCAYEEVGDLAEGWPPRHLRSALDAAARVAVEAWLRKHAPPRFWTVVDVQEHDPEEAPDA